MKSPISHAHHYVWTLPFIAFVAGYLSIHFLMPMPDLYTPGLLGKTIHEACAYASEKKLNIRLVNQKEDADLPDGTVIEQNPREGQKIRPYQTIFLVATKKASLSLAPVCIGKTKDEINTLLDGLRINKKYWYVAGPYPADYCIAQSPSPGQPAQKMMLYIATGAKKPIVWPHFVGQRSKDVIEFLTLHGIKHQEYRASTDAGESDERVIDQRPMAGSIITLDEHMPPVQLYIQ